MSTILAATDLIVRYNERTILDAATLGIEEGDRIGLVGRNGCGQDDVSEDSRRAAIARQRRWSRRGAIWW